MYTVVYLYMINLMVMDILIDFNIGNFNRFEHACKVQAYTEVKNACTIGPTVTIKHNS